jgi:hypothetical protein
MARVELTALRRNRKSWQPTTGRMAIVFGIFFCLFRALRLPRALSGLALISLI